MPLRLCYHHGMTQEPRLHPLRVWLTRTKKSTKDLASEVEKNGAKASPKYLEHIANELMEPGWHLCEVLEVITGVDARELKSWRYKNSERAA